MKAPVWAWNAVLAVALGWALLQSALFAGYLGGYPYQVESREGAQVRSTLALAEGRNPWAPAYAAQDYNCYGLLYPLTAAVLLPASRRGVQAHRVLSLAALALAALLLGAAAARLGRSLWVGAAAGLAGLGGFLYFVTATARCDAFAALFFTAALACLALWRSRSGLGMAVLLSALAFFTKPYAAVAGPAVALWLAGQRRWREAFTVGLAWALLLAALVWLVEWHWPGYCEATLLLHANAAERSFSHLVTQSGAYFFFCGWPLLLLAGVACWRQRPVGEALAWTLPALAMLALLLLWLGWHPGAYLQYYFQLLHPAALLAVAAMWGERREGKRWLESGLALCAVISVLFGTQFLERFQKADLSRWHYAEVMLNMAKLPMTPGLMCSVLTDQGKVVADNGQTEYLSLAGAGVGASGPALRAAVKANSAEWEGRLQRHEVDLVVLPVEVPEPKALGTYLRVGRMCLPEPVALNGGFSCYMVYILPGTAEAARAAKKATQFQENP